MNGVGTEISATGKVLDSEILSRHCKSCVLHAPLKERNPTAYDVWKVHHEDKCELNHEGARFKYGKHYCCGSILTFRRNIRVKVHSELR